MKFSKPFKGLVEGDRYERDFFAGDDVPASLVDAAIAANVTDAPKPKPFQKTKSKD